MSGRERSMSLECQKVFNGCTPSNFSWGGQLHHTITKHRRTILVAAAIFIALAIIIGLRAIVHGPASIRINADVPPNCLGSISYNVELRDRNGGIDNALVSVNANDVLLEQLRTDQNGRFSSSVPFAPSWCGKAVTLSAVYDGGFLTTAAGNATVLLAKIPTTLTLTIPETVEQGAPANILAHLTTTNGTSIPKVMVVVLLPSTNETIDEIATDQQGNAETHYTFSKVAPSSIRAEFDGNQEYAATSDVKTITVTQRMCSDGTTVETCAKTPGYYCTNEKSLSFDCNKCGCSAGLVCSNNACITPEEKNAQLIQTLQNQVVFVGYLTADKTSMISGSGVILAHTTSDTIILTNRHVINDANNPTDVKILTLDKQGGAATSIRIAPSGMDFAILTVPGTFGTPAAIDDNQEYEKGQDVVAIGSPGGLNGDILQGSVAKGIISNFERQQAYFDNSGYTYNAIQTDAAINHGNSGGGLFLLSNGKLIGINTLGGASTQKEGINFAIDIKELHQLGAYENWPLFVPTPKCPDGTAYNTCSSANTGYACTAGTLQPACKVCGCPTAYPYCPGSGLCFNCPTGDTPYETSTGQGFCCPPGTQGTTTGRCI